jgi:hypothetical protein
MILFSTIQQLLPTAVADALLSSNFSGFFVLSVLSDPREAVSIAVSSLIALQNDYGLLVIQEYVTVEAERGVLPKASPAQASRDVAYACATISSQPGRR